MRGRIGLAGGIMLGLLSLVRMAGGADPGQPPAPTLLLSSGVARIHSVALSADGTARVWDAATGLVTAAALSDDGKWLAIISNSNLPKLWDLQTGLEVRSVPVQEAWVAVVPQPGGAGRLFTAGEDGYVRVWDPTTGKELCRLANLAGNNWAVGDPAGRFDASNPRDLDGLHCVAGIRTFPLGHFADRFHEPGLLARIMRNR